MIGRPDKIRRAAEYEAALALVRRSDGVQGERTKAALPIGQKTDEIAVGATAAFCAALDLNRENAIERSEI